MYKLQEPVDELGGMFFTNTWPVVLPCCMSRPFITSLGKLKASGENLS